MVKSSAVCKGRDPEINTYVVHVLSGDGDGRAANAEGEVGEGGVTVEDPATEDGGFLSGKNILATGPRRTHKRSG